MNEAETGIGFPATLWSDIRRAADPSQPESRARLERLLKRYWRPIYAYLRARWRRSSEDAMDLTQSFLTHILENRFLAKARVEEGSFRAYLKRSLRNFVIDQARAEQARRPKEGSVRLNLESGRLDQLPSKQGGESPERAYDRVWFHEVLEGANATLERWLRERGKQIYFEVFKSYCLMPGEPTTYEDLAGSLGVSTTDVRHYLEYCRSLLRKFLREGIQEYVAGPDELERELREILGR